MLKNSVVSELAGAAVLPIENPTYITSRVPNSSLLQNNGVPDTPLKICKIYRLQSSQCGIKMKIILQITKH